MTLKEKYWSNLSVEITKRIFIVGSAVQFIFAPIFAEGENRGRNSAPKRKCECNPLEVTVLVTVFLVLSVLYYCSES